MLINLSEVIKSRYQQEQEREKKIALMRGVVSSWDKQRIQKYIYNQDKDYRCDDAGMAAIIERFINNDEFQIGVMSEELKMGFDIIRSISRNHRISYQTTDLIYEFIKHFEEVIRSYDRQSAQTYYRKLIMDYERSVQLVNKKLEIEQEMRVKY